ncbi:MAG: energy transducer TonB [Rhodothermales bacterium]|nr:energy transducer TonB [Rhodothermales bacterium]
MRTETLEDPRSARRDDQSKESKPNHQSARDPVPPRRYDRLEPSSNRTPAPKTSAVPLEERGKHTIKPYKSEGADHRTNYRVKVEIGLALALAVLVFLTRSPLYPRQQATEFVMADQQVIQIEDVQQTKQDLPPPPPPRPPVPIEVSNATILEDDELNLDATLDLTEDVADIPLPPPPPPDEEEAVEQEIFVIVEEMPELIGGIQALMAEIKYPPLARQAGVEGRVIVQLVVGEDGNPRSPVVLRGIGGGCDEEAVRAVLQMKFKPGKQRGRPVPVQYSMSVLFQLKERDTN